MAPARPSRHSGPNHHAEFIQQFTQQESQRRVAKQRKPLTAAQHATLRKQLQDVHFLLPDYADQTKINIAGILRKWKRYCEFAKLGPWIDVIKKADRAMAMDFLHHLCETSRISSWGSSWEYFRQYKQLYASATGRYMDRNDSREVMKWHDATLVRLFNLRAPNANGKDVAGSGELLVLLTFNIAYDLCICPLERDRVDRSLCYIFLTCTGARPAEIVDNEKSIPKDGSYHELWGPKGISDRHRQKVICHKQDLPTEKCEVDGKAYNEDGDEPLDEDSRLLEELLSQETTGRGRPKALCYEDVLLMVVRHPETGKDMLAMAIKLVHHKGADNKPKPTIFFFTPTRRLIFCLITVIVSVAVSDNAFHAPSLTSVRRVFEVRNWGPVLCTPLRWKTEWLKRPVVRRGDEALPYYKLRDDLARQSLDAGCERPMHPKVWRRGAANVANGNAPDATRDQMMRHDPKWATFNSAYINERVQFHLQNAVLDEPYEDALIAMLSHLSVTRDPRASRNMVPGEVWKDLPPDPEIVRLKERREMLKAGQYRIKGRDNEHEIRELSKTIRTMEARRDKAVERTYHEFYFYNRLTWEIERQARGEPEEHYAEPVIELSIPERARLAHLLCNQPENLTDEQLTELRIEAGELMAALCHKCETAKRRRIRQKQQAGVPVKEESPRLDSFPLLMQKTQCPRCIGDERQSYDERTFSYCRAAVMNDHFDREHLKEMEELERNNLIFCDHPRCKEDGVKLKHLDHFRNHVQRVHGIALRPQQSG